MTFRLLPLFAAAVASVAAAAPVVNFTGHTPGAPGTDGANVLTWEFDVLQTVYLTELSIFDENGDGLAVDHRVGLFSRATGDLLTDTTLAAGTGELLDGFFRTKSVVPVLLTAGERYVVVADGGSQENFLAPFLAHALEGYTVDPAILPKPGGAGYLYSDFALPSAAENNYDFYLGPNLSVAPVPEPASLAALGLGLGALFARRRKARS